MWKHIADTLLEEIEKGQFPAGSKLPSDEQLAARFAVNRHTVRQSLKYLGDEGLLRSERGRGTFVAEDIVHYRLGATTRFEQNLAQMNRVPRRTLVSVLDLPAPKTAAEALRIDEGSPVALVTLLGEMDGVPINLGKHYFPLDRFPAVPGAFVAAAETAGDYLSITDVLRGIGIGDYSRKYVRMTARMPDHDEASRLRIPRREPVIETEVLNVSRDGGPLMYGITTFCSSRVKLSLEF